MATGLPDYSGYQRLPSWVLGFHGCDKAVALKVLGDQKAHLDPSKNTWDWLGTGIYFWENDPARALQFAEDGAADKAHKVTKGTIKTPFVIGAIIDLGLCLNLFDQAALKEMKLAAKSFVDFSTQFETPMPTNKGNGRFLDRAVFEHLHVVREFVDDLPRYETVRAAFPEGNALYEGTEITEQNHIQIAVRDPGVIRGYFLPRL